MSNPERLRNAFNQELPAIAEILQDPIIVGVVIEIQLRALSVLGLDDVDAASATYEILACALKRAVTSDTDAYEREAHAITDNFELEKKVASALRRRAHKMGKYIIPSAQSYSFLDLGCGDGQIGRAVEHQAHSVHYADVFRHPALQGCNSFTLLDQNNALPFDDESFDTVAGITTLHHANNPLAVIGEICRITKKDGRVLLIETVYDVTKKLIPSDQRKRRDVKKFADLSAEQQRWVTIFFDHFYNRVINFSNDPDQKRNTPYNFFTPIQLNQQCITAGLDVVRTEYLGFDQPTVPVFHTLHVFQKPGDSVQ